MGNYLYNGVPLPGVNEVLVDVDTEKMRYAFIHCDATDTLLSLSTVPLSVWLVSEDGDRDYHLYLTDNGGYVTYYLNNGKWEDLWLKADDQPAGTSAWDGWKFNPIWANYDVPDKYGGSIHMAASDPIPVQTINPSGLLSGYYVGMAAQRMRNP